MKNTIAAAITAVLLTAGCASTPVRYLTLDMTPSGSGGAAVQIGDIELSDALRRPELLVQARETEIEYYSDAHWVSSLSELVAEKLEAEFGAPSGDAEPVRLELKLWQFGEDETADPRCGRVKLSVAAWNPGASLRDDPNWSKAYEACTPVDGADVSDVAAALSGSLEEIALQIRADVERQK